MLVKTLFIFLITFFACSEFLLGTSLIQRPIILAPLVGLVFGQLELGIVMGATLELAFIGAVSIGAYIPPDMISGTILGTALAIQAGTGPETALALGLPISTVMLALNSVVGSPIMLAFTHMMDKDIEDGNVAKFKFHYFFGGYCSFASRLIVIPCAFYFGSDAVVGLLSQIPEWLQTGINISGGVIPALGFAMLAQMIWDKKIAPFFFIGFFAVQYLGLNTTAIAIFTLAYVVLMFFKEKDSKGKVAVVEEGDGLDEF